MPGSRRRQRHGGSSRNTESPAQPIAMIDGAAVKAHSDLLAAGESISALRVAQSALAIQKAASFESLGICMQNVPSINRLMLTEAKVNSFIHCFVGVQAVTSLHDLEMAICESEGIKGFEELELGPLLKHPLVVHYFSIGCDVTEVFKITSEQIIAYLNVLLCKKKNVLVDDLVDYIATTTKQSRENLCIRIQSLGMHTSHIMIGRRSENTLLKKFSEGLDVGLKRMLAEAFAKMLDVNHGQMLKPKKEEKIAFDKMLDVNHGQMLKPKKDKKVASGKMLDVNHGQMLKPKKKKKVASGKMLDVNHGQMLKPKKKKKAASGKMLDVNHGQMLKPKKKKKAASGKMLDVNHGQMLKPKKKKKVASGKMLDVNHGQMLKPKKKKKVASGKTLDVNHGQMLKPKKKKKAALGKMLDVNHGQMLKPKKKKKVALGKMLDVNHGQMSKPKKKIKVASGKMLDVNHGQMSKPKKKIKVASGKMLDVNHGQMSKPKKKIKVASGKMLDVNHGQMSKPKKKIKVAFGKMLDVNHGQMLKPKKKIKVAFGKMLDVNHGQMLKPKKKIKVAFGKMLDVNHGQMLKLKKKKKAALRNMLTGRHGEELAFKFLAGKFSTKVVKWVNEGQETGLPYDIEVCDEENRKEYVEVKATNYGRKNWFEISIREWQFAVEKGESFSIARVVLSGGENDRVTVFKNPARLCRSGHLKLAVLVPKQ